MKKHLNAFLRTISGRNKTGAFIYGVLDNLPIPAVHNLVRLAVKQEVPVKQIPSFVWGKMDKDRLLCWAISFSISFSVYKGWLTMESITEIMKNAQVIREFLGYLMK